MKKSKQKTLSEIACGTCERCHFFSFKNIIDIHYIMTNDASFFHRFLLKHSRDSLNSTLTYETHSFTREAVRLANNANLVIIRLLTPIIAF